ncbi:MAG: DUF308 domain-containing protein, partial [Hyphomonadaceae bacterium]|nr:DUF308 domain-containing protein [Hyphomonadaceae bacterium]
ATEAIREHWVAFLVEGVLLTILGFAAMIVPPLASIAATIWLGWIFLINGLLVGLVLTFWAKGGGHCSPPSSLLPREWSCWLRPSKARTR